MAVDLGDEAALHPRPHPVVEPHELGRRPRRGDDELAAAVEQRIDDVIELELGLFAVHELHVVDQQQVDEPEAVLERHRVLRLQRFDELEAEALGGHVDDVGRRLATAHFPRNGVEQMRFAVPDRGVDVERVVATRIFRHRLGDLHGAGVGDPVRGADDEAVERVARIERRSFEPGDAGARADGGREAGGGRGERIGLARFTVRGRERLVGARRGIVRLRHRRGRGRRADLHLDALDAVEFDRRAALDGIEVVGFEPVLEELDRHGDHQRPALEGGEFKRVEPARINVVAEVRLQGLPHPLPAAVHAVLVASLLAALAADLRFSNFLAWLFRQISVVRHRSYPTLGILLFFRTQSTLRR